MATQFTIPETDTVNSSNTKAAARAACFAGAVSWSNFTAADEWEKKFELIEHLIENFPEDDNADDVEYLT